MSNLSPIPSGMKLGTDLTADDRREVLASYVHRFTKEHSPNWAARGHEGKPYPVQFASDAERLDKRHCACQSSPTWPDNPELRRPHA